MAAAIPSRVSFRVEAKGLDAMALGSGGPRTEGVKVPPRRWAPRGMTLIEILIVVVIVGVVSTGVIMGTGQLAGARLKRSAALVTAAIRVGYTRATATSKTMRVVFDIDQSKVWLEEANDVFLVKSGDKSGTGGTADPATDAEKAAIAEGERILKGPGVPRATFRAVNPKGFDESAEGPPKEGPGRELGRGVRIRSVETLHDDAPRKSGRAYLYMWPGGQTERAVVQLGVGDNPEKGSLLSLVVSPLTGKVTVKSGPASLENVVNKDGSEREELGAR